MCTEKWIGGAAVVIGLVFALKEWGVNLVGGLSLWPVLTVLAGIYLLKCCEAPKKKKR